MLHEGGPPQVMEILKVLDEGDVELRDVQRLQGEMRAT